MCLGVFCPRNLRLLVVTSCRDSKEVITTKSATLEETGHGGRSDMKPCIMRERAVLQVNYGYP